MMIKNYTQDFKLLDIVQNKRVVLIGPSSYLNNKKIGKYIDGFDIVCRLNNIAVPLNLREDCGYRTDVVFDGCDYRNYDNVAFVFKQNEEIGKNIKLCFIPGGSKADHKGEFTVFDIFKKTYTDNGYYIPFSWSGQQNYSLIESDMGCEPMTGNLSMIILLLHNVKELFITGFTFFKDKVNNVSEYHHKGYYSIKDDFAKSYDPYMCHNVDKIAMYFKDKIMMGYKDIVKVDSYLNDLLQLKHHNVYKI